MAGMKRMSCLEKRSLLNRSAVSVDELIAGGRFYEEQGLVHDAVDFYERAEATEELQRLIDSALEDGDFFLFNRLNRLLKRSPREDEWRRLAMRAKELGKDGFAEQAGAMLTADDAVQDQAN